MMNNHLEKFIDKQNVSFVTSVDEEGFPNIKAMLKPRKRNGLKEFYFSTNTSSLRVKQFRDNPNASIYFYHKGLIKYEGVMLIGTMEVLTDQETKNMIWRRGDTMFYKKGVTDPDYCVLKFIEEELALQKEIAEKIEDDRHSDFDSLNKLFVSEVMR